MTSLFENTSSVCLYSLIIQLKLDADLNERPVPFKKAFNVLQPLNQQVLNGQQSVNGIVCACECVIVCVCACGWLCMHGYCTSRELKERT